MSMAREVTHDPERALEVKCAERSAFNQFIKSIHEDRFFIDLKSSNPDGIKNYVDAMAVPSLPRMANGFVATAFREAERTRHAETFSGFEPLLIMHDWREANKLYIRATEDDSVQLPFPHCAFEFQSRIGDDAFSPILVLVQVETPKNPASFSEIRYINGSFLVSDWTSAPTFDLLVQKIKGWNMPVSTRGGGMKLLLEFVLAACVAIESKVGIPDLIPTPPKLNAARARRGKPPLKSYRIVNLVQKYREQKYEPTGKTGRKLAFHMRCAHFNPMRFETARILFEAGRMSAEEFARREANEPRYAIIRKRRPAVWVGEPNLAFIEHEYRI